MTKKHKIALFGIEQHLGGVLSDIEASQYSIHCVTKDSTERLSDFDSVMVFQGAVERVGSSETVFGESKWIDCDTDELDARIKEVVQVCKKGGFILVILTRPFHDTYGGKTYLDTDIAKRLSNFRGLYRYDMDTPDPIVRPLKGELGGFCDKYGRAYSYFNLAGGDGAIDFRPLLKGYGDKVVGFSMHRSVYFIPSLLPKFNKWEDYLHELAGSVLSIYKKFSIELPEWVERVRLNGEVALRAEIDKCEEGIRLAKSKLMEYSNFKRVLIESGEDLVKSVSKLLSTITALSVDCKDDKKEDCRLIDGAGNVVALIEVKGLNGNVKMSNVSQAFEHRERTPGYENLPVILIANTFIGGARSEEEKDKAPEEEQVSLAERHKVLILRTLDLLRMYNAVSSGRYTKEKVVELLLTKVGWWSFEKEDAPNSGVGAVVGP